MIDYKSCSFACAVLVAAQAPLSQIGNAALVIVSSPFGLYFGSGPAGTNTLDIDLDRDGAADLQLVSGFAAGGGSESIGINAIGRSSSILGLPPSGDFDLGSLAYPAAFGTKLSTQEAPFSTYGAEWFEDDVFSFVDPTPGLPAPGTIVFRSGSLLYSAVSRYTLEAPIITSGYWSPGTRRALGFRFEGGDGSLHYGWMDITVQSSSSLLVNGWAYDAKPNTLVTPFAIPEVGTVGLVVSVLLPALLGRRR